MKKSVVISIIAALAVGIIVGIIVSEKEQGISGYFNAPNTIIGSSSDLKRVPQSYVMANTTTTDATFDGGEVNQVFKTEGLEKVRLNVSVIPSVTTSTLNIRPQISQDGTNYFDLATTTLDTFDSPNGTSTVNMTAGYVLSFTPGVVATVTKSFVFDVTGGTWTRFLISSPWSGEHNSGTQAWIQAIGINEY